MDTKRMVIGTALAMALFFGWFMLLNYINSRYGLPQDPGATAGAPATAPAGAAGAPPTTGPGVSASPGGAGQPAAATGLQVLDTGATPAAATLGSATRNDARFALQLVTTPVGAGVESVVLNKFLASVEDPEKRPYRFQQAEPAVQDAFGASLSSRAVTIDGTTVGLNKAVWKLEGEPTAGAATYSVTIGHPGQPVLRLLKTFRVFERDSREHGGLGYEVRVEHALENLAGRPLTVSLAFNGPVPPPRELDNGPDRRVMAGYRDGAGMAVENHYVETFSGDTLVRDLTVNEDKVPAWWVGASSVYFDAILMPPTLPDGRTTSVRSIKGHGLNPDAGPAQPLALTAETTDLTIPAGQRFVYPLHVYFGPKWREVLNDPFYAALPRDYDQSLVVRAGPCAVCTFDWLINVLVVMLGVFHTVLRDWGLAIIALVVLVRLLLHPITKRSQISMLKMGKMGPEMERLRKKYGDNKEELQKAMWEFQKQQGVAPLLGCLPMFLQMPIWIALWSALNTTFELRHSAFLWGFTWIDDLAKPDRLIPLPAAAAFRIPLVGITVDALNILPILLAGVFWLQQKYTPKPPAMTPEQEQQQKMMQWLVLIFPVFLYAQPSGLNLYILASTGIGIWESKRIRQHIKEKEEAEKAGVVIIDAPPPTRDDRRGGGAGGGPGGKGKGGRPGGGGGGGGGRGRGGGGGRDLPDAKPSPGGWLARKLAELQEKAEQVRREAERGKGR